MAAEVNARSNKNPTIAFTLPISCQVCLGKVKNPVLCPNQHVFCGPCMDVWLQKNKHCPACRTSMTAGKQIIGGLSQQEDDSDRITNPDLRKARFDLLYKEYENEFERMDSEIQLLKTENQILRQQTRKDGLTPSRPGGESSKSTDSNHLLILTRKLQDATKLYEKLKGELTRLKQENTNLKDENLSLNRENQHLRQELAGRSPHRYGRITVTTLESKLASAEKDVSRLTKALERSDKYIEELETQLDDYRGKSGSSKRQNSAHDTDDKYLTNGDIADRKYSSDSKIPSSREYGIGEDNSSRRQLFTDDRGVKSSTGERSNYYYERNGDYNDEYKSDGRSQSAKLNGDNGGKKKVTFDLNKNTNSATSFDLELPSPLKMSANASVLNNGRMSPVKGVLKKSNSASIKLSSSNKSGDKSGYSTDLSKDSLSDSYNQRSADRYSNDDLLFLKSRSRLSNDRDTEDELYTKPRQKYSADDSVLSEPSDTDSKRSREYRSRSSDYSGDKRSDPLDDLEPRSSRDRADDLDRDDLDDTKYIESELDELNISLTPEFTDCMKILNRAEKNVITRVSDPVLHVDDLSKYRPTETDMDTAFRASTGSIGRSTGLVDDLLSNYKADTSKFVSSLDSYSRGRHVRSGSLDNIYIEKPVDQYERPSSALPSTSNMYPANRYTGGLTTGRTTLTRTPSLDNLLMARQSTGFQNKYSSVEDSGMKSRTGFPAYTSRRMYGEDDKVDVNSGSGSVPSSALVTAKHSIIGSQSSGSSVVDRYGNTGIGGRSSVETILDVHAHDRNGSTGIEGRSSVANGLDARDRYGSTGVDGQSSVDNVLDAHDRYGNLGVEGRSTVANGLDARDRYGNSRIEGRSTFDTVTDVHTRGYSSDSVARVSTNSKELDIGRKLPPSGRQTPTVPIANTGGDADKHYSTGRITPTIPTHSEYMAFAKPSTDKYNYTTNSASGRSTPILTSNPDYATLTQSSGQYSELKPSGPSSLPTELSQKPPSGSRSVDPAAVHSAYQGSYSSQLPSYLPSSTAYTNSGGGYHSLSNYTSSNTNTGVGSGFGDRFENKASLQYMDHSETSKYPSSVGARSSNYVSDKPEIDASSNYRSNDNYTASNQNLPSYNDNNYIDGTEFSNFSTKVAVNSNIPFSASSLTAQANLFSASSTGPSSSSLGLSSYPGSSSSYLPTTLTSLTSSSSYSTAHSVPLTFTSSSYTSSLPTNTYTSKALDAIAESGHYSYVSNMSGDYSSKNDTFALPEPKKRLFENSDDLDMSVSPIKANRRF